MKNLISFQAIRIISKDLSRSRDFYSSLFEISPFEDEEAFVSFLINGVSLDLCLEDLKNPSSVGGSVGYWLVEDLDKLIQKALSLGASVYRGPIDVLVTGRRIIQIQDPVGGIMGFEENMR